MIKLLAMESRPANNFFAKGLRAFALGRQRKSVHRNLSIPKYPIYG
jgi:hypothetical protein